MSEQTIEVGDRVKVNEEAPKADHGKTGTVRETNRDSEWDILVDYDDSERTGLYYPRELDVVEKAE